MDNYLTPRQLQEMLKISSSGIYNLLEEDNGLPFFRIGRSIRVKEDDFETWITRKRHPESWWADTDLGQEEDPEEDDGYSSKSSSWWSTTDNTEDEDRSI